MIGAPNQNAHISKQITVTMIARYFCVSFTIPTMPNIRESGVHPIISNTPSVTKGLPHPGWRTINNTKATIDTANKLAAIFPKRIFKIYGLMRKKSSINYFRNLVLPARRVRLILSI